MGLPNTIFRRLLLITLKRRLIMSCVITRIENRLYDNKRPIFVKQAKVGLFRNNILKNNKQLSFCLIIQNIKASYFDLR